MAKPNPDFKKIKILTDIEEKIPTESFKNLAKQITGMILGSTPQYTIGVYGEWGTGKTTMMRAIQNEFEEQTNGEMSERIPTVWFNAWRYEREQVHATLPLIVEIVNSLSKQLDVQNKKEEQDDANFTKIKNIVVSNARKFVHASSGGIEVGIPGVGGLSYNIDPSKITEDSEFSKTNKEQLPSIYKGLEKINHLLYFLNEKRKDKLQLVVFIDDLDRCSPQKALQVFESIKILLDISGIVYVVGLSHDTIDKLISTHYKESEIKGSDYIQKIIQIPINLPIWETTDFKELIENNIRPKLDKKYMDVLEGKEDLLYLAVGENPRQLKRLINNIILSVDIYGEKEGIEVEALLSVELMRSIWPNIFKDFCVRKSLRDKIKESIDETSRFKILSELRKKTKDETQILNVDEKKILEIKTDFWEFINQTKDSLFEIKDWKVYRNISALPKDETNPEFRSNLGVSSLNILKGHTGEIHMIDTLPDGKIVSGSLDHTIRIWDPKSGNLIHTLVGHEGRISDLVTLPDGKIASASHDQTVKIWDPKSGNLIHTLVGHQHTTYSLTVLPDGKIASGSFDSTIRIWDPKSGNLIHTLVGHDIGVVRLVTLPDGKIASASHDQTVKIWDPKSGNLIHTLVGHKGAIWSLTVLPDGKIASGSTDHTIRIWDPKSGNLIHVFEGHTDTVWSIIGLTSGRIASGSDDHTIRIW